MSENRQLLADSRLAASALAPTPAWAWSVDAERVLWANGAGTALLGSPNLAALQARSFERKHAVASQVARLADMLPADGTARLDRLRGLAPGIGRLLTCSCARVTLSDGTAAILITATEAAGPALPVNERVRRLLDGLDAAVAAFSSEGALLFATTSARDRLGDATTLTALGAQALAATALAEGQAAGASARGPVTLWRIASGGATVLFADIAPEPAVSSEDAASEATGASAVAAPVAPAEAAAPEPMPAAALPVTVAETTSAAMSDTPAEADAVATADDTSAADAAGDVEAPRAAEAPPAVEASTAAAQPEPEARNEPTARNEPEARDEPTAQHEPEPVSPREPEPEAAHQPAAHEAEVAPQPQAAPPAMAPAPAALPPLPERRHPLRFVWQIDGESRLTVASDEFIALMGPAIAGRLGRSWAEVTEELGLDPTGRLTAALGARDTFSGVAATWPIEDSESLPVELSGLPLFDRDRKFSGYRGFGVCRDVGRLNAIAAERREGAAAAAAAQPVAAPVVTPAEAPPEAEKPATPEAVEAPVAEAIATAPEEAAPLAASAPAPTDAAAAASAEAEPTSAEAAHIETARAKTAHFETAQLETAATDTPAVDTPAAEAPADVTPVETTAAEVVPAEPPAEPAAAEPPTAEPPAAEQPAAATTQPAGEDAIPPLPSGERPLFTVVPTSKNVVPFRAAVPIPAEKRPALTSVERTAFQEIAKALGARIEGEARDGTEDGTEDGTDDATQAAAPPAEADDTGEAGGADDDDASARDPALFRVWPRPIPSAYAAGRDSAAKPAVSPNGERAVLDRLPVGVLVYRGDDALLHANRALLDWTGYEDLDAIAAAGGLERLFAEPGLAVLGEPGGSGQRLAITTRRGESLPVECRLFSVAWHDGTALMIVLQRAEAEERVRTAEQAVQAADERIRTVQAALEAAEERMRQAELAQRNAQAATGELESILETATDGVLVVDRDGIILSHNRSVEALFGQNAHEFQDRSFVDLFAPESHRAAQEYLNGLIRNGVASVLNDGREVIGRVRDGGLMPLFMTLGRLADDKFCIVFRDITQWKRSEEDLTNAKREAEKASSAKSDFLAKVSHEIRTPLSAIIGFADVMIEQRFGPVGNDRYSQYMKDIKTSGEHVISLVNDLLDLSKIEAGKLELNFASVSLSNVVNQCVAIMQPQANRERIIIRTSLMPTLPPVVADERSMRQIVLNLLSNSIKFTGAGGQVIVSTALTDQGEAVLRVRDTGIGMSEKEIATAMEPFRQVVSSGRSDIGTGLGLPLTKALAEANRATFAIKSAVDAGTLVEICFPATRVLAE